MLKLLEISLPPDLNIQQLEYPQSLENPLHYSILLEVKRKMEWVGTTKQILQRISILKKNTKLSVREQREVRKLTRDQIEQNICDLQLLVAKFPLKDPSEIRKVALKTFKLEGKKIPT
jgi:hypothetical protein